MWSSVAIMSVCSVWLAWARSERMKEAERTLAHAQRLLDRGEVSDAAAALEELVRDQPWCASARAMLADVLAAQGQEAQAIEHYRALADRYPQDAQAYYDLAACCLAIGRYDLAERYLRRRIQDAPQDAHARCQLAFVYEQQGQLDKALDQLDAVVKLPGSDGSSPTQHWARTRERLQRKLHRAGG